MAELDPDHPCVVHNCHRCCIQTEMTLTAEDVRRISGLGYRDYYRVAEDDYLQMVNVDGKCFFLKKGHCIIYDHRPEGCRLYPLILDVDDWEAMLHDFCPYRNEFHFSDEEKARLKRLIETQEVEKASRIRP